VHSYLCSGFAMKLIQFNLFYVTFLLLGHFKCRCVPNISRTVMAMSGPRAALPASHF
jgi:hypothetical protein